MRRKRKQRKLLIDILTIIAVLVAVLVIYIGLQLSLATDTPLVAIASGSMSPALEIGDFILVQGTAPVNIQVGDIIVFNSPEGSRTIHRVTETQTLTNGTIQFRTKGDANPAEDPYWIPENSLHGRVLYRIPYLGWLALDPTIPIIIVSIVIIIVLLWPERRRRWKKQSTWKAQTDQTLPAKV